jgi:hypothetical protein
VLSSERCVTGDANGFEGNDRLMNPFESIFSLKLGKDVGLARTSKGMHSVNGGYGPEDKDKRIGVSYQRCNNAADLVFVRHLRSWDA